MTELQRKDELNGNISIQLISPVQWTVLQYTINIRPGPAMLTSNRYFYQHPSTQIHIGQHSKPYKLCQIRK